MAQRTYAPLIVTSVLGLLILAIVLPKDFLFSQQTARDPGVYRYVGQRILQGEVPYRDVWDHKPPAIFYIYAAGIALAGGAIIGVAVLECLALGVAAAAAFGLLRQAFGPPVALAACVIWLVTVGVLYGGGGCEVFALPIQFLALAIMVRPRWSRLVAGLCLGILLGVALLLKPNTVGIWIGYGLIQLYAWLRYRRALLGHAAAIMLGFMAVIVPTLAYFARQQALAQLYDAVILYNRAYATTDLAQRLGAGLGAVTYAFPLALIGLVGWALGVRQWRHLIAAEAAGVRDHLVRLALIGLPIEALLTMAIGRVLRQYYLPWSPALLILGASALSWAAPAIQQLVSARKPERRAATRGIRILLWGTAGGLVAMLIWLWATRNPLDAYRSNLLIIPYIARHTAPGETVLLWGAETQVNADTGRAAPTRFVYQYPLFTQGYQRPELAQELLADLAAHPPALIIDTSPTNTIVPPLAAVERRTWTSSNRMYADAPELAPIYAFVSEHYCLREQVGFDQWPVYAYGRCGGR